VSEIREWLERLYANSPGYFGITAFAGGRPRRTKWFATSALDAAERTIKQNADVADLYLSVATHIEPQDTRGGEKSVLSIPGFWTDLDIGELGHQPASLPNPETEEEALSIVDSLPEPSMIMHSGGGLQGFWIFENGPWILDTEEEKAKAKKAIQEWGNLLEQLGREKGFHVDKVADLARILRVPGSINHKQGTQRPVVIRWSDKSTVEKERLIALGIPDPERPSYEESTEDTEDKFPLTWNQILAPHGYKQCDENTWVRPGKNCNEGISLSVPEFAPYVITNFSESDPRIPVGRGTKLTKLKLYAKLNFGDDIDKAEKALSKRKLKLTWANTIEQKPVHWMWEHRIALGTLALLAGREGIGKSTLAYTLVADITKGLLPGAHFGKPKTVIIVATEDDWSFTIVPRLNAAKADLTKVARVEPTDPDEYGISLPRDIEELSEIAKEYETALILLDPLMSRVDAKLDTHKDSEVRKALEPLVKMAGESGAAVLGIIHVNKSGSSDPLSTLMGSRAFSAVARAVLYVVQDPENLDLKVMGQPKNNLGRSDLPDLAYTLKQVTVGEWEGEEITSVQLNWAGDKPSGHIRSLMNTKNTAKTKTELAAEWLEELLSNGPLPSQEVKELAKLEDISEATLKRAFAEIGGVAKRQGHGKTMMSTWQLSTPEDDFNDYLETIN
jgi:energy-coupling factor transporter ATP-binding protein EcfA2